MQIAIVGNGAHLPEAVRSMLADSGAELVPLEQAQEDPRFDGLFLSRSERRAEWRKRLGEVRRQAFGRGKR